MEAALHMLGSTTMERTSVRGMEKSLSFWMWSASVCTACWGEASLFTGVAPFPVSDARLLDPDERFSVLIWSGALSTGACCASSIRSTPTTFPPLLSSCTQSEAVLMRVFGL